MEERVGEQGLGQLPEVHLQSSGGHVDVLPLPVLQVHLLVWGPKTSAASQSAANRHATGSARSCTRGTDLSPWLTAKRSFCMTARLPLTLYKPSTHRPEREGDWFSGEREQQPHHERAANPARISQEEVKVKQK